MELLFVRHAEPVRILAAEGPADPPLHERGRQQAERLAAWLSGGDERIDVVWSSPMRRARETAEPVAAALGLDVLVDDELAEFDREATTYIPIEELKAAKDERWVALVEGRLDDAYGVDPAEFRAGVVRTVERVIATELGRTMALVCHGGVINAYLGHVLGVDRQSFFEPRYTSVSRVAASTRHDVRSILTVNETAHLRGTGLLAS